ncbi:MULTISPECIES: hypothetical protein [Cupriavidus]|nr:MULTISPECIES: hypothetical protein [Cupriavidus]MCM3608754.1 hypothetical protein [Cupriavidus pauculus]QGS27395.1 hypothetical protein FOB83_00125 [Cupriavidus metallidurans]
MTKPFTLFNAAALGKSQPIVDVGEPEPVVGIATDDYIIALANLTNIVVSLQRMKVGNNPWTAFTPMAPIGRTCSYGDPKKCADEGKYQKVTVIGCGGASFSIELRNHDGEGAVWDGLYADCQYGGGVLFLVP